MPNTFGASSSFFTAASTRFWREATAAPFKRPSGLRKGFAADSEMTVGMVDPLRVVDKISSAKISLLVMAFYRYVAQMKTG